MNNSENPPMEKLLAKLALHHGENLCNFYRGTATNNLRLYLTHFTQRPPQYILLGEAAGYQGARQTGITFTSEAPLPSVETWLAIKGLTPATIKIWKEPSATIVWKAIRNHANQFLLWNAVPWHPHKPSLPDSNRTPNKTERKAGLEIVRDIQQLFPIAQWIGVGRVAQEILSELGLPNRGIRHPANGGATRFTRDIQTLAQTHPSP